MAKLYCKGCRARQIIIDYIAGLSVVGIARKYSISKNDVEVGIRTYLRKKGKIDSKFKKRG